MTNRVPTQRRPGRPKKRHPKALRTFRLDRDLLRGVSVTARREKTTQAFIVEDALRLRLGLKPPMHLAEVVQNRLIRAARLFKKTPGVVLEELILNGTPA